MKASVLTCAKWNSLTPEHLGEIASQVVQFRHASCGCFSGIHKATLRFSPVGENPPTAVSAEGGGGQQSPPPSQASREWPDNP